MNSDQSTAMKSEYKALQETNQQSKDCVLDDIIYYCNNIDFDCSLKGSIDSLYSNFIMSEEFNNLPKHQKETCLESFKNLAKLNNIIEQFQKENKIYRYSK